MRAAWCQISTVLLVKKAAAQKDGRRDVRRLCQPVNYMQV